jgi:hypothetical protein
VFYKTALRSSVHIKISVKLIEIRVFQKIRKCPDRPPEIPEIPVVFFRFSSKDSLFLKIREKFPENRTFSEENFPKNPENLNSEIPKIRKVPKRRFWKIQPRLQSV